MPSNTICDLRTSVFGTAAPSSNSFFVPASVVSIGDSPEFSTAIESRVRQVESSDENTDGLGLARGIRSAIAIQGCIFLMGYGIWHLWHLAH